MRNKSPKSPRPAVGITPPLAAPSAEQAESLRTWLALAFDQAVNFNGSQKAEEDLIESLDALEKIFAVAANQNAPREYIETAMINAVNAPLETPRTIDEFLAVAGQFYHRLETANNFETTLNILERAGVPIMRTHDLHIPPGAGEIAQAQSDDPNSFKITTQPRLAWLVAAMKERGIFTSDIMITVGNTPKNIVRKYPYVIIDIPYVPCQIAVCDQVGERSFITDKIYDMDFWKNFNKELLKATDGVAGVICRTQTQWVGDILEHITKLRDPATPRVDMKAVAAHPQREKIPVTLEAIEDSCIATYEATGKWPKVHDGVIAHGALKDQISWSALDQRFKAVKYEGYTSLADFMEQKGFKKNRLNIELHSLEDIAKSIQATFDVTGKWPKAEHGMIEHGSLAQKIKWGTIYSQFESKKYPDYDSFPDFMEKKGFKKNRLNIELHSLEDIAKSIQATFDVTGKWPKAEHGMIEHGPLAQKIKWATLHARFLAVKYEGYTSLADFIEKKGFKKNPKANANVHYSLDDIAHSILATRTTTGRWPAVHDGMIAHGALKDQTTWIALNQRFRAKKYEGYTSLAEFKDAVKAEYEAGLRNGIPTPPPATPPAP